MAIGIVIQLATVNCFSECRHYIAFIDSIDIATVIVIQIPIYWIITRVIFGIMMNIRYLIEVHLKDDNERKKKQTNKPSTKQHKILGAIR